MRKFFLAAGTLVMIVSVSCIAAAVLNLLTGRMALTAPAFWAMVACHALTGVAAMSLLDKARESKGGAK